MLRNVLIGFKTNVIIVIILCARFMLYVFHTIYYYTNGNYSFLLKFIVILMFNVLFYIHSFYSCIRCIRTFRINMAGSYSVETYCLLHLRYHISISHNYTFYTILCNYNEWFLNGCKVETMPNL